MYPKPIHDLSGWNVRSIGCWYTTLSSFSFEFNIRATIIIVMIMVTRKVPALQYSPALYTILKGLAESVGKEDPTTQPLPLDCLWEEVGGTYMRPKDSNATVGVSDCGHGRRQRCLTDGQTLRAL